MSNVDIYIRGHDQASRAALDATGRLAQLRAELGRVQQMQRSGVQFSIGDLSQIRRAQAEIASLERGLATAAGTSTNATQQFGGLKGVLGSLGVSLPAAGAAGIVALGVAAGKAAFELGQVGEQARRSETYFTTFSGGATAAAANLKALEDATEGALSSQQAMQAATKLLSMGLATNADDLGRISRMAVLLGGDTRTASEAIEEFSLLLANQSIPRLDTFGISGARVRARIEELQAAQAGLSRETAFMTAVMEIGGQKVAALEEAGMSAGTGMDRAKAAAADLKVALGKLVEQPYTVVVNTVTEAIEGTTEAINNAPVEQATYRLRVAQQARPEYALWQQATLGLADADAQLTMALADGSARAIERAQVAQAAARAHLAAAAAALDSKSAETALAEVLLNVANGAYDAIDAEREYLIMMADSAAAARDAAGAMDDLAAARARATARLASGWGSASNMAAYAIAMRGDTQAEAARDYAAKMGAANVTVEGARLSAARTTNSSAANDYAAKMSAAISKAQAALSKGMNFSIGLSDQRGAGGDMFAPGADGPFEDIYRLQAWINDGSFAETAAQLGITSQQQAQQIVADFQKGLFTPAVIGAIDTDALAEQLKIEEAAQASTAAFAAAVAKQAGVGVPVAQAFLGLKEDKAGQTEIAKATKAAADGVLGGLGEQVAADAFKATVTDYGGKTFGYFETGFVSAASRSAMLQAAIDGMVTAALSRRGAVSGAAGSFGF